MDRSTLAAVCALAAALAADAAAQSPPGRAAAATDTAAVAAAGSGSATAASPVAATSPASATATTSTAATKSSASPAVAPPPPATPTLLTEVQANAFVSFGYTYNFNRPPDRLNGLRLFDENANTFDIDVAELVLQKPVAKAGETGFRVDLVAGGAIPQKTQSYGLSIGQSADLQQAFVSYVAPVGGGRGLRLDFGKFVTHAGYEVIEGYDGYDDNYSRSLLFNYAIPLTHTGVKATYAASGAVSAMVMVVNGWDNVRDNNSGKTVGAQLALTPAPAVSLVLNYIGGPEKTDTNGFVRNTFDVVATWKVLGALTLGFNGVYGVEDGASLARPGADAVWKGVAGYARYAPAGNFALALRGETFRDEGGTRLGTGVPTTAGEGTLTPTYKLTDRFLVRGDLRVDAANKAVFQRDGAPRKRQATFAGNVIFVY
jgi:hypothetical protein